MIRCLSSECEASCLTSLSCNFVQSVLCLLTWRHPGIYILYKPVLFLYQACGRGYVARMGERYDDRDLSEVTNKETDLHNEVYMGDTSQIAPVLDYAAAWRRVGEWKSCVTLCDLDRVTACMWQDGYGSRWGLVAGFYQRGNISEWEGNASWATVWAG